LLMGEGGVATVAERICKFYDNLYKDQPAFA
jgi:hypothetical protein